MRHTREEAIEEVAKAISRPHQRESAADALLKIGGALERIATVLERVCEPTPTNEDRGDER